MKIILIVDESTSNYTLGVISRNSEIKLDMLLFFERIDNCSFENPFVQPYAPNFSCCDALVVAVQNMHQICSIFSHVLPFIQNNDKAKIVIVRPSCIDAKSNFIIANNFDQEKVIELPVSDTSADLLSERLHTIISPKTIAKQIYRTHDDNIEAYQIEKMYVKILSLEELGIIGCGYTVEGVVLDSWTNGRVQFYRRIEEKYLPVNSDNVINVDNVCPLIRLWTENYFHFMTEVVDKILVAEELGFTGKYMLYHNGDTESLTLIMGIPPERIIWIEHNDIGKVFLINNVFDVEGFIVRTQKTISRLCNKCNDIVAELIRDDNTQYPRMLYIPRIGSRKLLGVEEIIKEFNFYTFIPENHSLLEEEIKYFNNADIILCPHGAALANAVFMKEGAALIETCPCNWSEGAAASLIIASVKNLIYRQIVEPATANPFVRSGQFRDYHVNNPLLVYTIKELTNHIKHAEECNTAKNDADQI